MKQQFELVQNISSKRLFIVDKNNIRLQNIINTVCARVRKKGFITLEFEPVGKWFEQYNYLRHQGDADFEEVVESSSESEDENDVEETPEYIQYLETLDPKNWKDQDHYKVLGLENLRYKATPHQLKKARTYICIYIYVLVTTSLSYIGNFLLK